MSSTVGHQPSPLTGIWGIAANDLWAVASDAAELLHYDGTSWSSEASSGTWLDVHGANGDVWLVGQGGAIAHREGAVWRAMSSGTTIDLYGVWRQSAKDVWAVGGDGTVLHFDDRP
jgi:hypothetical protein